jgi:hypothetical protein
LNVTGTTTLSGLTNGFLQVIGGVVSTGTVPTSNTVAYNSSDSAGGYASYLSNKLGAGAGIAFSTAVDPTYGTVLYINSRANTWRPTTYPNTTSYVVLDNDDTVVLTSALASPTVTLPTAAAGYGGRVVTVQNAGSTGTTTISVVSGTIFGLTPTITTSFGKLQFFCVNTTGSTYAWICE